MWFCQAKQVLSCLEARLATKGNLCWRNHSGVFAMALVFVTWVLFCWYFWPYQLSFWMMMMLPKNPRISQVYFHFCDYWLLPFRPGVTWGLLPAFENSYRKVIVKVKVRRKRAKSDTSPETAMGRYLEGWILGSKEWWALVVYNIYIYIHCTLLFLSCFVSIRHLQSSMSMFIVQ